MATAKKPIRVAATPTPVMTTCRGRRVSVMQAMTASPTEAIGSLARTATGTSIARLRQITKPETAAKVAANSAATMPTARTHRRYQSSARSTSDSRMLMLK